MKKAKTLAQLFISSNEWTNCSLALAERHWTKGWECSLRFVKARLGKWGSRDSVSDPSLSRQMKKDFRLSIVFSFLACIWRRMFRLPNKTCKTRRRLSLKTTVTDCRQSFVVVTFFQALTFWPRFLSLANRLFNMKRGGIVGEKSGRNTTARQTVNSSESLPVIYSPTIEEKFADF